MHGICLSSIIPLFCKFINRELESKFIRCDHILPNIKRSNFKADWHELNVKWNRDNLHKLTCSRKKIQYYLPAGRQGSLRVYLHPKMPAARKLFLHNKRPRKTRNYSCPDFTHIFVENGGHWKQFWIQVLTVLVHCARYGKCKSWKFTFSRWFWPSSSSQVNTGRFRRRSVVCYTPLDKVR